LELVKFVSHQEGADLFRIINSFFLSRKTIIVLLVVTFAATILGGLVPQRIATSSADLEAWRTSHPLLLPWADRLGLFHLFFTPWFAAVLCCACISLTLSAAEQFRMSLRKTFPSTISASSEGTRVHLSADGLQKVLRRNGYRLMGGDGVLRFVRHPWGYWSNFLLHSGMLLIITVSLFIALTEQRGALILVEGGVHDPRAPWAEEERGKLAPPFMLPNPVRLDHLRVTLVDKQSIQQAASDISFIPSQGDAEPRSVAVNKILTYQGMRIYQTTNYGDLFTVEFTDPAGLVHRERLLLPYPPAPDQAGYNDFRPPWLPWILSAKYYADADRGTMASTNPMLVMRLLDGSRELSRVSLKVGERGNLGNMKVRLDRAEKWSKLIFVNVTGMPLIFFGFLVVVTGSILHYMAAPREIIATEQADGYSVTWRAARFADFYQDEFGELVKELGGTS
jgi:cytochrome c biogenesis protein